jgi:hypothetical protein
MGFLDFEKLGDIAAHSADFLNRRPFPWSSLDGLIREDGFKQLRSDLPPLELCEAQFGLERAFGQKGHDRYALQYSPKLDSQIAPSWRGFVGELHSEAYGDFVRKTFGLAPHERFVLSMHWHYAPRDASVSPHTDARRKIGSHIFYFNAEDWDPAWGGQTLVLDDGGIGKAHTAPSFESLREAAASDILGNKSFIFKRTEHSWHGVRPLACPAERYRTVFIVVINRLSLQVLWRRVRGKDPDGYAV